VHQITVAQDFRPFGNHRDHPAHAVALLGEVLRDRNGRVRREPAAAWEKQHEVVEELALPLRAELDRMDVKTAVGAEVDHVEPAERGRDLVLRADRLLHTDLLELDRHFGEPKSCPVAERGATLRIVRNGIVTAAALAFALGGCQASASASANANTGKKADEE